MMSLPAAQVGRVAIPPTTGAGEGIFPEEL